jgi:hypothetical protein
MNVSSVLDRIDWDFPRTGSHPGSVHLMHWFPGNFIPQIPTAFIQALSRPCDLVFDPFCGSGTTGNEALRLGRRAILSDRISACVLVSNGKLEAQTTPIDRRTKGEILSALTWDVYCRSEAAGKRGEGSDPDLVRWFTPVTLARLRYLWSIIEIQEHPAVRRILMLAFSDVLFACASPGQAVTATGKRRRHHWGWVADNVRPTVLVEHDACRLFEARLALIPERPRAHETPKVLVLQQDARRLALSSNSVDLIVTSPPYIGVIDYVLANRLLYAWMGWPLGRDRVDEIGARFKRRRQTLAGEYLEEMRACWHELARVLRKGAYCAIVIGESRRYPGIVDQTLGDLETLMPRVWGPVKRIPSRRRVSDRNSQEASEFLCVFRKS